MWCNKLKTHAKHRETLDEALGSNIQINSNSLFEDFAAPAAGGKTSAAPSTSKTASSGNSSGSASKIIKEGWLLLSAMQTLVNFIYCFLFYFFGNISIKSARKYPMIPLGKDNWGKIETVRKVLNTTITGPTQQGQSSNFL